MNLWKGLKLMEKQYKSKKDDGNTEAVKSNVGTVKSNVGTVKSSAAAFSKKQLLNSEKYAGYKDLLSAVLSEGATYTFDETDKFIEGFLKKGVD